MPKLKTHQGMKKRVKVTSTGKLLRGRPFGSHLLEKKSPDRKRNYSKLFTFGKGDTRNVKKLIGKD